MIAFSRTFNSRKLPHNIHFSIKLSSMKCKDNSITFLKSLGYSIVRLPRAGINPLQILIRKGNTLETLGELSTLLTSGSSIALPIIRTDVPAATISGQRSSDISIGVGLSILGSIIGAMGGSKIGLEITYDKARTIAFEYYDVLSDSIEIAALDQYLSDADVNPFSRYVTQLLESDDVYVITSTIKSKKFHVEGRKKDKTGLEVSIPEIKGVVGGNIKVSGQSERSTKVTFEGTIPLIFGFKAVRLIYDNGKYTAFNTLEAGVAAANIMASEVVGANDIDLLVSEGPFINLSEF